MPLFVTLPNGNTVAKDIDTSVATVADLKVWAAGQCAGVSPLQLGVFGPAGAALPDTAQLTDALSLEVQPLLPGGKVHGSLARAGKVRGQTPKVAKQEKKKTKTGRAKRRMQYNKRFVATVALPGGRKRGPNAQAVA